MNMDLENARRMLLNFISKVWWRGYNGLGLVFKVPVVPIEGNIDVTAHKGILDDCEFPIL